MSRPEPEAPGLAALLRSAGAAGREAAKIENAREPLLDAHSQGHREGGE